MRSHSFHALAGNDMVKLKRIADATKIDISLPFITSPSSFGRIRPPAIGQLILGL